MSNSGVKSYTSLVVGIVSLIVVVLYIVQVIQLPNPTVNLAATAAWTAVAVIGFAMCVHYNHTAAEDSPEGYMSGGGGGNGSKPTNAYVRRDAGASAQPSFL